MARRHEARIFSAGEQDVLNRVARMAGAALRAASRPAPRGPQSDDPVTGLPLGRRFAADAEAAVRTAERQGIAVSVLAVHVDGLSRIRTDLGEQTADDVLRALAAAVQPVLRVGDLAYRLGSDELALLLPATDAVALAPVRERLDAVAAEVFERLSLPGGRRHLTLRTARVSLHERRPGPLGRRRRAALPRTRPAEGALVPGRLTVQATSSSAIARSSAACSGAGAPASAARTLPPCTATTSASLPASGSRRAGRVPVAMPPARPAASSPCQRAKRRLQLRPDRRIGARRTRELGHQGPQRAARREPACPLRGDHPVAPALQAGLVAGRVLLEVLGGDHGVRLVPHHRPHEVGLPGEVVVELRLAGPRRRADVVQRGAGDALTQHELGRGRDDEVPYRGAPGGRPRDGLAQQTSLVSTALVGSTGADFEVPDDVPPEDDPDDPEDDPDEDFVELDRDGGWSAFSTSWRIFSKSGSPVLDHAVGERQAPDVPLLDPLSERHPRPEVVEVRRSC